MAEYYSDWFSIGTGCQNFLCYGSFPLEEGRDHVKKKKFWDSGIYLRGQYRELDPAVITEEVTYSWYEDDTDGNTPDVAVVTPNAKKKGAYSWLKSPRYNGEAMEVGPLARQWVNKNPDVLALGDKAFSVMGRHFARAVEASQLAKAMKEWVLQLEPGQPVCTPHELPKKEVVGVGLCEGSRGALGHWHRISADGRPRFTMPWCLPRNSARTGSEQPSCAVP